MMRAAIVALVIAAACGGSEKSAKQPAPAPVAPAPAPAQPDRCHTFVDRSKPILEDIITKAGKTVPPGTWDQMLADCRAGKSGKDEALVDCVAGAADQPAVATCWQAAFQQYQDSVRATQPK